MTDISIKNGVNLYYINDDKFKTTAMVIYIHRKLNAQDASKNALIPMVLKRGCEGYSTFSDIEIRLQELYGAELGTGITKRGEDQILCFEAQAVSDKYVPDNTAVLPGLAELLLKLVFKPSLKDNAFDAEYVEGEKQNLSDMIDALQNDKQSYALWRCYEEMCKDEPYGIHEYGDKSTLSGINAQNLYEYYREMLASSRIDIFVCGTADIDALAEQIRDMTEDIDTSDVSYPCSEFAGAPKQVKHEIGRAHV